jgi:hypothetical protein
MKKTLLIPIEEKKEAQIQQDIELGPRGRFYKMFDLISLLCYGKIRKTTLSQLARQASKIKISKKLDSLEDAPFFKKKMEKGAKMLSLAGLPK